MSDELTGWLRSLAEGDVLDRDDVVVLGNTANEIDRLRGAITKHYKKTKAEACCMPDLATEAAWALDRALWKVAGIHLEVPDEQQ